MTSEASTEPVRARPIPNAQIVFDRLDAGSNAVISRAFLARQIDGTRPFARTVVVNEVSESTIKYPPKYTVVRQARGPGPTTVHKLLECPAATIALTFARDRVVAEICASSHKIVDWYAKGFLDQSPELPQPDSRLRLRSVYRTGGGTSESVRRIASDEWESIDQNYPGEVRTKIGALTALERPENSGRLILWHGPSGTGKTTAIRSLARHWQTWCDATYVIDPEQLFGNAGYLHDIVTDNIYGRDRDSDRWQLIITEDSDEYLRSTARSEAGAALGRLLNLTDGILGQDLRTIIMLTTNEDINRLHPALVRPGRCLAEIYFRPFSPAEAAEWLPDGASRPVADTTLAELFERRGATSRISATAERAPSGGDGMYL